MLTTLLQSAASTPITIGAFQRTLGSMPSVASYTSTPVTTQTTGSTFVVWLASGSYCPSTLRSLTDSLGNTYVQVGSTQYSGAFGTYLNAYICINGTGGASHSVTVDVAARISDAECYFLEIKGGGAFTFDGSVQQGNVTNQPYSLSITTSAGNDIILSFARDGDASPYAVGSGSGFTALSNLSTDLSAVAQKISSTAATHNANWTSTTGDNAVLMTFALKQAAAAPAGAALAATLAAQASIAATLGTGIKLAASAQAVAAVSPTLTTSIKLAATFASTATVTATLPSGGIAAALSATLTSSASVSASLGFLTPSFGSASASTFTPVAFNTLWTAAVPSGQTASDVVMLIAQNTRPDNEYFEWPPGFNQIVQYKDTPSYTPNFGYWGNARIAVKQGNPQDSGVYTGKAGNNIPVLTIAVVLVKNARKNVTPVSHYDEFISNEYPDIASYGTSNGPLSASTNSELPLHLTLWTNDDTGGGNPALTAVSNSLFSTRDFSFYSNVSDGGTSAERGLVIDHAGAIASGVTNNVSVTIQSGFVASTAGARSVYLPFTSSAIATSFLDFSSAATLNLSLTTQLRFKADFVSPPDYSDPEDPGYVYYYNANMHADLTASIKFAATPASQATLTASLGTAIRLASSLASQASASAALTTSTSAWASALVAQASLSASLTNGIRLSAAAASQATVSATLASGGTLLSASPLSQASLSVALTTGIPLALTAASQASLFPALTTNIRLVANTNAIAAMSTALQTGISLYTNCLASSSISFSLLTKITLSSGFQSSAAMEAMVSSPYTLDPNFYVAIKGRYFTTAVSARTFTVKIKQRSFKVPKDS